MDKFTRRSSLARLAGLGLVAAGLETPATGNAAIASGAVQCVLTPELEEGPYYLDGEKLRRDIREGHPGAPLSLHLKVLDASTCKPIKNAAVDIWHCDAGGVYSGFNGASNRTFLRGIQKTDAHGLAVFTTIYPGWYQGRTTHIHVKVHVGGSVVHTGQVFFPDTLTAKVYGSKPYASRGQKDTSNATDHVYVNGGRRSMLTVVKQESGYVASISMGVHR